MCLISLATRRMGTIDAREAGTTSLSTTGTGASSSCSSSGMVGSRITFFDSVLPVLGASDPSPPLPPPLPTGYLLTLSIFCGSYLFPAAACWWFGTSSPASRSRRNFEGPWGARTFLLFVFIGVSSSRWEWREYGDLFRFSLGRLVSLAFPCFFFLRELKQQVEWQYRSKGWSKA